MKIKFFSTLCIVSLAHFILAQSKVVSEAVIQANDGTRTYIIARSLTIKAPTNGTVSFAGAPSVAYLFKLANPDPQRLVPPSCDQNFVRTETILVSGITTESQIPPLPVSQKTTNYEYLDGLGRKLQSVVVQGTPQQRDAVVPFEYDANGRMPKEFNAYAAGSANGSYKNSGISDQLSFFTNPPSGVSNDSRPFKENVFEASPLDRVTDVFGPGLDWKNGSISKSSRFLTKLNQASEAIIKWKYTTGGLPERDGTYGNNELTVSESVDEEGKITRVYKTGRDLVVLNRVGDGTNWFDTYNLYSPSGLLMFVIQPEGVARLASEFDAVGANKQSFVNRWCFQYQYDDEQRMIAKRIPGWTDWAYTVFDRWNRVVLTQTPAQRARNEYSFNKYDRFNRAIMTGLWVTTTPLATLRTNAANSTVRFETEVNNADGYTLTSTYPTAISSADLRSISYYDNYTFLTYTGWDAEGPNSNYNFVNLAGFPQNTALLTSVKGHATGSKTRVLGQTRWLNSVTHYDTKYRSVQTISENYVGGRDRVTTLHDFTGRNLKTQHHHTASASTYTCLREFDYDHMGRVLRTWQTTDAGPRILLSSQAYNEIGQLVEKNLHSEDNGLNFLQSVDMRYNIRGWLTSINNSSLTNDGSRNNDGNDLFGMELLYNPASPPAISGYPTAGNLVPKLYDGNITAIKWKTDTKEPGVTPQERIYGFDYDVLSRLEKAHYAVDNAGAWTGDAGMFNEAVKSYDRNGNIQGIERQARINGISTPIDNTTYGYNYSGVVPNFNGVSNRLLAVSDAANARGFKDASAQVTEEYRYDASGNLIFDHNKSISNVVYNFLNLPEVIEFTRPNTTIDRIEYTYDAAGNKLRQVVKINGTQVWKSDYVGDLQYDNDQLVFASTPEGRVVKNSGGWDYEYFHKDHQGNVRLTYGKLNETLSYRATLENPPGSTLGATEENAFRNINTTRHTDPALNYTRSSDQVLVPDKSAKVNGFEGRPIGPAKSLQLGAGDKVKMEVFARYNQVTGSTATIAANVLVAAVATSTFGFAPGETGFTSFNSNAPVVPGIGGASATVPKAYLAYLFFDQNFVFITSGAVSITTAAFNAFERLERTFTAPQAGYLYVYVANESNTGASAGAVYFDETLLVHQKNNSTLQVTQASDYYPFGLAFNTYQAERVSEAFANVPKNRYGFQGQEWQSDLDLGWSQFKWRMHDPALGRFGAVDPLSDKYLYNSTYAFSENKVVGHVELEGLESMPFGVHYATYGQNSILTYPADWLYDKLIGGGVKIYEGTKDYLNNEAQNQEYQTHRNEAEYAQLPEDVQQLNYGVNKIQAQTKMAAGLVDQLEGYTTLQGMAIGGVEGTLGGNLVKPQYSFLNPSSVPTFESSIAAKGVTAEGAVWAQKTFSGTFSAGGKFAGQTVDDVAGMLRSGTLSAADVPINVVVRNGQTFILNTRSSAALMRAGIPRSSWNVVNQTGVSSFESMLTGQLGRNGLINGTNTIRQSGTQLILSH